MSTRSRWSAGSRRLAALFLAVVAPPTLTLVWLGWLLLQQDRSLWVQRELEERQALGMIAVGSLAELAADAERWATTEDVPPPGVMRLTLSTDGVRTEPHRRVLWSPVAPALQPSEGMRFGALERLEFQTARAAALRGYEALARSEIPAVRAGALVRAARVHRHERRLDAALTVYRELAEVRDVAIDGMPADLLARRAICFLFDEFGRRDDLAREAADLERDFLAGRWRLDRPTWELSAAQLAKWTGRAIDPSLEQRALTAASDWLWADRQRLGSGRSEPRREILVVHETPVTVFARPSAEDGVAAVAILPDVVQARLQRTLPDKSRGDGRITLLTDSGHLVAGTRPVSHPAAGVRHLASETGLPWTVIVNSEVPSGNPPGFSRRRQLLMAGLVAIVMLLAGGSYLLWRVVQRELAVARQQTNFVAAVSHEFRTPLASLRHVTELLEEDDALPPQERRSFYGVLARNTERLQRLVESLLDFARMEDGRNPYPERRLDLSALVSQVVEDFREDDRAEGFTIDCSAGGAHGIEVRADPVSLGHSLRNLLDNAVKYSPDVKSIEVGVERHPAGLAIFVRDKGLGIPRHEQEDIFLKFVRGARATQLGIKGTGLGLAMVAHVMSGHGGSVEVDSEEGVGSTFRLILPASRASPNVVGGPKTERSGVSAESAL